MKQRPDRIPGTIEDIDIEWLSESLGAPIEAFEKRFLEGGVLTDAFRVHGIRYATKTHDAPSSVVVKLPTRDTLRREMAIENGAYIRELNFFREIAHDMPLRSPLVYEASSDGSPAAARFVLVMEDLSVHSRVFDQIEDSPDEHYMRKMALEIAAMHAKYWEAPETRLAWVASSDHRYVFPFDDACRESPDRLDEFVTLWRRMYARELFEEGGCTNTERLTQLLCGPKSGSILDRIYDRFSSRPHTLLHGDLRADNIFRTDPARGLSVEDSQLIYIDWQLMSAGPPGPDLTQAWIHSVRPEVRRMDKKLLRQYHERLVSLQPEAKAYSFEMLVEDYILGLSVWWAALVTIGANTLPDFDQPESARMKRLWEISIPRTLIALEDHDCLAAIETIAAS